MEYFLYFSLFLTLYFQIFLLLSIWDKKKGLIENNDTQNKLAALEAAFLSTTIIVPCYNEERTVKKTLDSLLELEGPKEMIKILVVDDGSTDRTWEVLQQYKDNPQIVLMQKENEGSKFAVLNFALQYIDSDLVGVLDADSWVSSDALKNYMEFFADPEVMATIPSMVIAEPDSFLRHAQKAEYDVGLFARKAFSKLNAIYITPGPFSVFRKYVFDTLGPYKEAHHTEDAEIALRMQKNGYKIAYSENSIVYTVGPKGLGALIKQRVRWTYGFIRNVFDYREFLFNKKYRSLGLIILPIGLFRIFLTAVLFPLSLWLFFFPLWKWIQKKMVVGFSFPTSLTFDWFFVGVNQLQIFSFIALVLMIVSLWVGRDLVRDKKRVSFDIISMIIMYTFISPLWLIQSSYNALTAKKGTWR